MNDVEERAFAPRTDDACEEPQEKAAAFECPKCGKSFNSVQALRMHRIRVHTLAGRRGAPRGVKLSHAQHLERRRQYQLKLRERYRREGKDSRGRPRPEGWKPRRRPGFRYPSEQPEYKRRKYREQVKANRAAGLNARGKPLKSMSAAMKESWAKRREQPEKIPAASTVQFCPRCGCNIKAVTAAIQFSDRQ